MSGIVKAITNIVKAVVNVVVSVVKAVVDFVGDVIGFVLNPFGIFDTPDVPDPGQQAQGVTVTKSGTNVPLPVVYGHRRVGGITVFAESNGESNKYLYVVYAVCEGEILGFNRILVNDVDLPLPSGVAYADQSVQTVSSGRFANRIKFQCFNGTENQPQSSLANETPTWPKKQRKLPGVAYVVMRFEWKEIKTQEDADNNPFSGGIPQVKFDVLGKTVYDVRTHGSGKTLSGSYSSRTKKYSFNPANCLLDYLENPRYGANLNTTEIDAEAFKIAANKFEQTVKYSNTQTGRALTMNAVVNTGAKVLDNVKALTSGSRGIMPFVQGRYKLKVEDGGHPTDITSTNVTITYDVDKREIIGGLSLDGERKNSKYNQVIVNYIDPDKAFSNQQVVYNQSGDQTIDNDEQLSGEFTFHTVTNRAIAYDLAALIYKKSRKQTQISFTASQELLDVEVGDVIRVTDTVLDLSLDTYRVVGIKLRNDGNIDIEAVEHDATVYPFTTGPQVNIPPPIYIPDDFTIDPYVRPLPANPVTLVPIVDPDVSTITLFNPPGDTPDSTKPFIFGISKFENFDTSYTAPDGSTVYYRGFGASPLSDYNRFTADGTKSLIYYPDARAYTIRGLARKTVAGFFVKIVSPLTTLADQLVIQQFENGTSIGEQVYDFRRDAPAFYNPGTGTNTTTDYYTGLTHPMTVRIPVNSASTKFRVFYRNSRSGDEYEDQSSPPGAVSSYTYTDWRGKTVTKSNLEAIINLLADDYSNDVVTANLVKQSVNLGA